MKSPVGLFLVAVALLLLSGCAGSISDGPPDFRDLFNESRRSDRAPAGFHDDVQRESCGEFTLLHDEPLPEEALACVDAAIGKRNAELAVLLPTVEGDPAITFYRTSSDAEGIEMFYNGEYDKYGKADWSYTTCTNTMALIVLEGCQD